MIKKGTAVIITFGPLAGLQGTLVSRMRRRVVVRVMLGAESSVLMELDDAMVERQREFERAANN